jgi:hypothetical protein
MQMDINYWAVLAGALLYFAGGALWYSPVLFANSWMEAVGLTKESLEQAKKDAWKSYLISAVSVLLICYGMARLMGYMDAYTLMGGIQTGFWSWLIFVMTTSAINSSFAGRPLRLYLIDGFYHLYGFLVAGIILGVWR